MRLGFGGWVKNQLLPLLLGQLERLDRPAELPGDLQAILVTGGASFIGEAMVRRILASTNDNLSGALNLLQTVRAHWEQLLGERRQRPSRASLEHIYGRPVVLTHCSNNYVPRQLPEKLIPLYGDAGNHGPPREPTKKQIVGAICGLVNQLQPVTDRPEHDRRYAIDATKGSKKLGWRTQHSFEQGLEAAGRLMLDNLEWCHQVRQRAGYRSGLMGQL